MNLRNLERLPEEARRRIVPFLEELLMAFDGSIISIFVYGSVTGPDYNPRESDINLGVVLEDISLPRLAPALKAVKKAFRARIPAPLFLSPAYIKRSLDAFPIEFIGMKDTRLVLLGSDVLADIEVKKEDLLRECEYQLKGRLVTIRQAYLEQALDRKGLERLVKASFKALMPALKGLLMVKTGLPAHMDKQKMLDALEKEFGVNMSSFREILRDGKADGKIGGKSAEGFIEDFLSQTEKLVEAVG